MKLILNIAGMSCAHCEKRVETALKDIGVKSKADFKKSALHLEFDGEKLDEIKKTIEDLGYKING